jgi:hypothetical protein
VGGSRDNGRHKQASDCRLTATLRKRVSSRADPSVDPIEGWLSQSRYCQPNVTRNSDELMMPDMPEKIRLLTNQNT